MVSTRGLRYKFSEGERVLCYEPDPTKAKVLYDSKVLEVIESKDKRGRRTVEYLIHFQGWNSSWDRCVSEDFILKDSQENRQLQRDLAEKSQLQLGAYLYRREPKKRVNTTAHPGPAKRARHGCSDAGSSTSTQPDVEPGDTDSSSGSATSSGSDSGSNSSGSQQRLQHKPPGFKADIPIPPALRDRLTFDYHLVVKRGRLSRLPASPCAAEILESFVKWFAHTGVWQATRTRHAPPQRPDIPDVSCRLHLVREVAEGIRIYIDFILGDHLLYRQEQNQYWQICGQYNEDVKPKSENGDSQEEDTVATDEERNSPKMPEYSHLPPDPVRNQNDKENDTENEDETEEDEEDEDEDDDEKDNEEDQEVENALHNNVGNHSHESETEDDDDEMENGEEDDESDVQDNGENEDDTEHNNIENEVDNASQDDTENEEDDGQSNEENNEDNVLHNNVGNIHNAVHNIENDRDDSADSNEDNDEDSENNDAENEDDVHNNVGNNDSNVVHNNGQNVPNNVENGDDEEISEEDNEHRIVENGDDSIQNDAEDMENDVNRQNEVEQNNEEDDGENEEDDDEEMDVDDVGENDEDNGGENDEDNEGENGGENDQENYEDEDSKSKVMESIDGRNSYNYATSSSDPNNECDGHDVKVKVEVKVERVKVEASSEEVEPCEEVRPRARRGHYARRLRSYKSNKSHSESEEQAPSTSTGGEQRLFDTQSSSVESTMSSLSEEWRGAVRAAPAPPSPPSPPSPPTLKRTPLSLLLEKVSKWRVIPRDESTKHLPCRIYGATHLARLFVKLPEFLNATNMAESKLKIILKNIDMFVQYLDQHGEWFGEVHYMSDGRSDSH